MISDYVAGFAVPTILLFAGMFSKKIIRGTSWIRSDFYLGVELTLGALTSTLLHFFDLLKISQQKQPPPPSLNTSLFWTCAFIAGTFIMFLFVLSAHQDWEKKEECRGKVVGLGIVCNFIGFALMVSFLLGVKGIH